MEPASDRPFEHFLLPWLGGVLLAGLCLFQPLAMRAVQEWILLAVFLLAVAPHIACDPWLPAWERGRPFILGEWLLMVFYLALGAVAVLALGLVSPFWTLVLFLALTLLHWGWSDALAVLPFTRDALSLGLARGALLLHAPVVFAPQEVTAVLLQLPLQGHEGLLLAWFRLAPLVVLASLLAEVLVALFPSRPLPPSWRPSLYLHLAETILLIFLFWAMPPLLALAAYFTFFHHWRYVQFVEVLQAQGRRQSDPSLVETVLRFARAAAPLALVVLTVAMAGFFLLMLYEATAPQLVGAVVWGLAMLTPAHFLLGLVLQARGQDNTIAHLHSGPADRNLPPLQRGLLRILKK